jgi:prevent-host-death family protein
MGHVIGKQCFQYAYLTDSELKKLQCRQKTFSRLVFPGQFLYNLYVTYRHFSQLWSPAMTDISAAEARKNLSEILNRVAYTKERVVLTRHGNQIAAIVPLEDLNLLTQLHSIIERQDVDDAISESAKGMTVSWTDLKGEMGL